ncbi:MAG TPA: DapH/DapD/GlmU-related protein [Gemmataceae bacterium]|nr:DapH/DapD/GlmU-related protein [Gemmataceae bacterium]
MLFSLIRSDLDRFTQSFRLRGQSFSRLKVVLESLLFKAGFQAVLLYRISHWLHQHGLTYPAWFLTRLGVTLTGAEIEFNARIGPGLFLAHPVGVVIGRGTVIGARATIFQGVTFGAKSWHPDHITRFPAVGDDCFFFAGCMVLGGVTVGSECVVAANAVVTSDMPDGTLAKGVPARLSARLGSEAILSWSA